MTTIAKSQTNDFEPRTTIDALEFGVAALRMYKTASSNPDTLRFYLEATRDLLQHTLDWAQFGTEHPEHLEQAQHFGELRGELTTTIAATGIMSEHGEVVVDESELADHLEAIAMVLEVYAEVHRNGSTRGETTLGEDIKDLRAWSDRQRAGAN